MAMVERDLVREDQEGRTYWSGGSATVPRGRPGAWLLSEFDELVLGYKDWMLPGPPGVMPRPIVAGAGMVGTWRRTQGRHEIVLELCLLEPQPASFERALDRATERFREFHGIPVRVIRRRGHGAVTRRA